MKHGGDLACNRKKKAESDEKDGPAEKGEREGFSKGILSRWKK